jgi:hypothetical protein
MEREQEEIVRMHQGFAQQKMAIAGAAGAGMGVGGLGMSMGGGGGYGGGMGGGMGVHTQHQQRGRPPQMNLALPGTSSAYGGGMGGGTGGGMVGLYKLNPVVTHSTLKAPGSVFQPLRPIK